MDPNLEKLLRPPEGIRGITELDKGLFEKEINVRCLRANKKDISKILPLFKKHLLKIHKFKPVQNLNDDAVEVYLNPISFVNWDTIREPEKTKLMELNVNSGNLQEKTIKLGYDNYSSEDVLRAVLPEDREGSASFSVVGHIVHVNLREHLSKFKKLIGRVLHDKIPNCRTVVNKTNNIHNTYRNFSMEILHGEDDMRAKLKENNCTFEFDFSTVYWNSRLCTEHQRIVDKLKEDDVLFDVFSGVGPFAVPAAKKKCLVYANDLNPESFKWLNHNKRINKINNDRLTTFNKDGRDFILQEIKELLAGFYNKRNVHITMNLPALAVEFVHLFVGLLNNSNRIKPSIRTDFSVIVHCYSFAKGENPVEIAKKLLFENIGFDISDKIIEVFQVRTVSSMKEMMRISFTLDDEILLRDAKISSKRKIDQEPATNNKKCQS